MQVIKTPCIGVCSTGIGDSVCRGCKRFSDEVIHWNAFTDGQKQAVLQRIDVITAQVVSERVDIFDLALLEQQLQLQGIRYDATMSPNAWVFELLKMGAGQIVNFSEFGCRVHYHWQHLSLVDLKQNIDEHIYTLSVLHFERYFYEPA